MEIAIERFGSGVGGISPEIDGYRQLELGECLIFAVLKH